jgi:hypothetical protein
MKLLLPILSAVSALAAAPAFADTAEEAVAYAFLGLADGASLQRATTTMDWKESAASPATFEGDLTIGGHAVKVLFTVTAVDKCHYDVMLEGPMVRTGRAIYAKIDLSKVTGVTVADHAFKAEVAGHGFCETGQTNPNCVHVAESDLFGFVDVKRHQDTLAFIRDSVCPAATE